MREKMKHTIWSLMAAWMVVLLLTGLIVQPARAANSSSASRVDAVLVVDVSNSMNTSDPDKIGNEAMKMFVDMLSTGGDKVGIVAYTDVIQREKALLTIQSQEDKAELKSFIDGLNRGAYTDTSVGVREAMQLLKDGAEPGHAPMIVLLADGNNDFNPHTGRTDAQADQDMKQSVAEATAAGIPIYTIGLNADGKLNKDRLADIADQSGGKSFITDSAEDLPDILSQIFASNLNLNVVPVDSITGNGDYQDVKIHVPNDSVMEANISITSSQPVDARLIDPNGQTRTIPADDILLSSSKSYSLLKLLKPEEGDWTLQIKGVKQDQIDINLIFNYDLQLMLADIPAQSYSKGDSIDIQAFLSSNNQRLQDQSLYANMTAKLLVHDVNTGADSSIELSNEGDHFAGQFQLPEAHDYELTVRAEEKSFYRESATITINGSGAGGTSGSGSSTVQVEESEAGLLLPAILGGAGLLIILAAAYFLWKYVQKSNKGFVGQLVIEIQDDNTGEKSYPQYKKLTGFRGKFTLHQLLQLTPELAESAQIVFTPGRNDKLAVRSTGAIPIEKSGRAVQAAQGIELGHNDRITVPLGSVGKTILLEYLSTSR
mgnify:CR=1 FL=1